MRVTVGSKEYIDLDEIAKLWGLSSGMSVTSAVSRAKRKRPDLRFPEPDLIIDQKFFWDDYYIPQIMTWRRRYTRGY